MSTDEVRTTSATGGAKGVKRARFDQIPTDSLWELAEHYGFGNSKYEPTENGLDNWRNGYEWSKNFAAAFRHLTQAMGGEDIDPESGSKHVIAVAWHMLTLAHWMNRPDLVRRFDDRQAVLEEQQPNPFPEWAETLTTDQEARAERAIATLGKRPPVADLSWVGVEPR